MSHLPSSLASHSAAPIWYRPPFLPPLVSPLPDQLQAALLSPPNSPGIASRGRLLPQKAKVDIITHYHVLITSSLSLPSEAIQAKSPSPMQKSREIFLGSNPTGKQLRCCTDMCTNQLFLSPCQWVCKLTQTCTTEENRREKRTSDFNTLQKAKEGRGLSSACTVRCR